MTPRLYFWTFAFLVFVSLIGCALLAFREIRRGRVDRHRRFMNAAILLVLVFVLVYVGKVFLLGREDLSTWSRASVLVLRFHETVVALMILAGGAARALSRRVRPEAQLGEAKATLPPAHRWLGRTALVSGVLALITATMVWVGMLERHQEQKRPRGVQETVEVGRP